MWHWIGPLVMPYCDIDLGITSLFLNIFLTIMCLSVEARWHMVQSTGTTLTEVFMWNSDIQDIIGLIIKQLLAIFQNLMLFSNIVPCNSNISVWIWSNTVNIQSALRVLMAWCFNTRASVATVLSTHPCVSSCLCFKWYYVAKFAPNHNLCQRWYFKQVWLQNQTYANSRISFIKLF